MPHIHADPGQVDLTVTLFIIRQSKNDLEIMLHKHKKLGTLLPVGGHVEVDETPWQAAARELEEESGYTIDSVKVLQPAQRIKHLTNVSLHPQPIAVQTHDIPNDHFHSDLAYALFVEKDPTGFLIEGESQDIRWFNKKALRSLKSSEVFANTKEICEYLLATFNDYELIDASSFSLKKGYE